MYDKEPDLLFRYRQARIKTVSTAGDASTITFSIIENGKEKDRWCLFQADRWDKDVRKAIEKDCMVNLLIGRYIIQEGEKSRLEDYLEDLWFIIKP